MIENQSKIVPETIITDNGLEFYLSSFYNSKGSQKQKSCVQTLQQNRRVKIKHQHILNLGRELLYQSMLSKQYWTYIFNNSIFLINRVTSPII